MPAKQTSKKNVASKKSAPKKTITQKTSTPKAQTAGAPKKATATMKATPAKKTMKGGMAKADKKPVAKKMAKTATPKVTQEAGAKKTKTVRSFKVQLPGTEEYTGRYTGSTPYQAANKALSKYFRTVEKPESVVTFSIRESTRGSKHGVYTYEGHRIKLETPVTYTIGDGNTIVKNHKNQLKKVKKADMPKQE